MNQLFYFVIVFYVVISILSIMLILRALNKKSLLIANVLGYIVSIQDELNTGGDICTEKMTEVFSIQDTDLLKSLSYSVIAKNLETFTKCVDTTQYLVDKLKEGSKCGIYRL